jgi:hypothetical protein
MGEAVVTKAPTCTEKGEKTATCKNCTHTVKTEVPATGHDMGEAVVTTAPTCTEKGEKTATCKNCTHTVKTEVPATGHDMGDWVVVTEPTTDAEGLKEKACKNDGCTHKESEIIAKLPVEVPVEPETPEVPEENGTDE